MIGEIFLQQETISSVSKSLWKRILDVLNYKFIEQKDYSVSILSLIIFVLVIFIAVLLSRYLRRFLKKRVIARLQVDPGIEYSLLRVIHYTIVALGLIYALKAGFGADLTSVAVILGFLSVGIGFGLQYLASDLVSGVILLFERPMRVGDRVKVGDMEGQVRAIRIRTTIIITADNLAVIVPNSEMVKNRFTNFSLGSPEVRVHIPVGVAYESDVDKVTEALLEAAYSVDDVMRSRPAEVRFKEFGDSSLNFELLVWVDDPQKYLRVRSKVNYEIFRVFNEKGIEIPFPQQDLRIRSGSVTAEPES